MHSLLNPDICLGTYCVLGHACSVGVISTPMDEESLLQSEKISYFSVLWFSEAQPYSAVAYSLVFNLSNQGELKLN